MRFELRAGMRGHASTNPDRKMIAAWERPDVTFEVREKLHGDGVGSLRNEITLGHFQLVALQRARLRQDLITCPCCQHKKISTAPLAFDRIARLRRARVHA